MENLISLAQKGLQVYEAHHNQARQSPTHEAHQSPTHEAHQSPTRETHTNPTHEAAGAEAGERHAHEISKLDHEEVINKAQEHVGHSDDCELFAAAMRHLSGHDSGEHTQSINHDHVTDHHKEAYEQKNASNMDAKALGIAAAVEGLKHFTSRGGEGTGSSSQLVSLAMSEASKLFDSSGGAKSGNKQEAITSAAKTVMKLVVQSKLNSGGTSGGGHSSSGQKGDLEVLMNLARKYL